MMKRIVLLIIIIPVIVFLIIIFIGFVKTSYFNYELYYRTEHIEKDKDDKLSVDAFVISEQHNSAGYVLLPAKTYMANIGIKLASHSKGIQIQEIEFLNKTEDVLYSVKDCESVYNSSKKEMVSSKDFWIHENMYLVFNYKELNLPNIFFIRVVYLEENKLRMQVITLKKSKRFYFTTI